jgi:hypothetical protein
MAARRLRQYGGSDRPTGQWQKMGQDAKKNRSNLLNDLFKTARPQAGRKRPQ